MTTSKAPHVRRILTAVVCAGALLGSGSPVGAATPSVTVKPARNLTDGQQVSITWAGFHPKMDASLAILECDLNGDNTVVNSCGNVVLMQPATRSGSVKYTVHTGKIANLGSCGTTKRDRKCIIEMAGVSGGRPTEVAGTGIVFAVP